MNIPTITIIGDVDDGKSTLIGNLLIQTRSVAPGLIQKARDFCIQEGIDFEPAYLVDYIREEREQKSTREWALAELKIKKSRVSVIDTPGQMTLAKKMISGLTQANIVILVLDIAEYDFSKYRYYFDLLDFLNIKNAVVAVNKMDLIHYNASAFNNFVGLLHQKIKCSKNFQYIPISALYGDNLDKKSKKMAWHQGQTIVEYLNFVVAGKILKKYSNFIMPVQDVYQTGNKKKTVVGKVLLGKISKNNILQKIDSEKIGEKSVKVEKVFHLDKEVSKISENQNGALILAETKIKRGDFLVSSKKDISRHSKISARIYIIDSFRKNQFLFLRYFTRVSKVKIIKNKKNFNFQFLPVKKRDDFSANDFADVDIYFNNQAPFFGRNIAKILPEAKQIVLENKKGEIVAIGIIK